MPVKEPLPTEVAGPHRDQDEHKGATENDVPQKKSNAPALDENGLPNDATAIAQDALGAQADESQG